MTLNTSQKKRLCIVAIVIQTLCLMPFSAVALGNCTSIQTAEDTIVGVGTLITAVGCSGETTFTITPPHGAPISRVDKAESDGTATIMVAGSNITAAGRYVVDGGGASASFNVLPGKADANQSSLDVVHAQTKSDGSRVYTVKAILRDAAGNAIPNRAVVLVASDMKASISAPSRQTDEKDGTIEWTVRTSDEGSTVTAFDIIENVRVGSIALEGGARETSLLAADITGGRGGDVGVVDHFDVVLTKGGPVKLYELYSVVITARDKDGNIVPNYTSSVLITSSDPEADYPGIVAFRPADLGVRSIPLSFKNGTIGPQTFTFSDKNNPSISGTFTVQVNDIAGGSNGEPIVILEPKNNEEINTKNIPVVKGLAPSNINLVLHVGALTVGGESDSEGMYEFSNVPLDPSKKDHSIMVMSENGQYKSKAISISFDNIPPDIVSATLSPQEGKTKEGVTLTVSAEAGLPSVTATIGKDTITLNEASAGTYSATIPGQPTPGIYDVKIAVADRAGNIMPMLMKLPVAMAETPPVTGVSAEGKPQSIVLRWNALPATDNIDHYNIYVAEAQTQDYFATLKARYGSTSATVKGLKIENEYTFFMTAVRNDGTESVEKSNIVTASPLGLSVKVVPQNGSLLLEMNPPAGLPLSQYRVAFGTDRNDLRATLTFPAAQTIRIPDLINGVAYVATITPFDVTGKKLEELSTTVVGTPSGQGFRAAAPDPVPGGIITSGSTNDVPALPAGHGGAPLTTSSGLPTIILVSLAVSSLFGMMWWKRRSTKLSLEREFMDMMKRRYHQ